MTISSDDIVQLVEVCAILVTAVWGFARISADSKNLSRSIDDLKESISDLRKDLKEIVKKVTTLGDRVTKLEVVQNLKSNEGRTKGKRD